MNELGLFFNIIPVGVSDSVEFEINGTQFGGVNVNGADLTLGVNNGEALWVYEEAGGSGVFRNKITIEPTPNNITISLPQNADTTFATFGRTLEGDFLNTLTTEQEERFYNYMELYNPSSTVIAELITDLKVDQQKAYEIIGKINKTGFYTTDSSLEKGGGFYKDLYSSSTSITDFYDNLLQKVRDTADQVIIGDGD